MSKLTDHNYDGIQELDNDLPKWWLASFYITIIYAVIYYGYYELGSGPSIQQEFESDIAAIDVKRASSSSQSSFPNESKLSAYLNNNEKLVTGKAVYQSKCLSCHGDKGQGTIGPNLTDNYWVHGDGKAVNIAKVIHSGVPEKGMPPWSAILSEDEAYAVTSYVKSLQGTNPPGAKEPQGNLIKE